MKSPEELAKIAAAQKELWKELMSNYYKEKETISDKRLEQLQFLSDQTLNEWLIQNNFHRYSLEEIRNELNRRIQSLSNDDLLEAIQMHKKGILCNFPKGLLEIEFENRHLTTKKDEGNKMSYKTAEDQLSEMSDTSLLNEYYLGRRSIFFVQDVKTEVDNRLSKIDIHKLRDFINTPLRTVWPLELIYEEMTKRAKSPVQPSFDPEHALYTLYNELSDCVDVDLSGGIADTQDFKNWLDQYNEKMDNKRIQLKQKALSKLTEEEKEALGLK